MFRPETSNLFRCSKILINSDPLDSHHRYKVGVADRKWRFISSKDLVAAGILVPIEPPGDPLTLASVRHSGEVIGTY